MQYCFWVTDVNDAMLHGTTDDKLSHLISAADSFFKNKKKRATSHMLTFDHYYVNVLR